MLAKHIIMPIKMPYENTDYPSSRGVPSVMLSSKLWTWEFRVRYLECVFIGIRRCLPVVTKRYRPSPKYGLCLESTSNQCDESICLNSFRIKSAQSSGRIGVNTYSNIYQRCKKSRRIHDHCGFLPRDATESAVMIACRLSVRPSVTLRYVFTQFGILRK